MEHSYEEGSTLAKFPECCWCGYPIIDKYLYKFGDELYCEDCINNSREEVDKYTRG